MRERCRGTLLYIVNSSLCSWVMGQHLLEGPCDLATLTFDLGGHRDCWWYGCSCSIFVPNLKFVGLPFRKIWHTFDLSISRPGDLDVWPFDLETGACCCPWGGQTSYQFWCFWDFVLVNCNGPTSVRRTTWPFDLDLWPWRSYGTCRRYGSSFSITV